jgi:hypothetical protein
MPEQLARPEYQQAAQPQPAPTQFPASSPDDYSRDNYAGHDYARDDYARDDRARDDRARDDYAHAAQTNGRETYAAAAPVGYAGPSFDGYQDAPVDVPYGALQPDRYLDHQATGYPELNPNSYPPTHDGDQELEYSRYQDRKDNGAFDLSSENSFGGDS